MSVESVLAQLDAIKSATEAPPPPPESRTPAETKKTKPRKPKRRDAADEDDGEIPRPAKRRRTTSRSINVKKKKKPQLLPEPPPTAATPPQPPLVPPAEVDPVPVPKWSLRLVLGVAKGGMANVPGSTSANKDLQGLRIALAKRCGRDPKAEEKKRKKQQQCVPGGRTGTNPTMRWIKVPKRAYKIMT